MTEEGLKKLKAELNEYESIKRPEISRQIAEARDKGDLSENAEYDAAKEAQGILEMKISQLKSIIANARLIDETRLSKDTVQIMTRVSLRNVKTGQTMEYTLVSETEADFKRGKLAVSTPIAKGLLGKKKGEIVHITIPVGTLELEIVDINF